MLIPSNSRDNYTVEAEQFVQSALDALSAHIAILDDKGTIIGVNAAWRKFADENDYNKANHGIGVNYLAVCDKSAKLGSKAASIVADAIRQVMNGQLNEFQLEYPCHSPNEKRWFVGRINRFEWYDQLRVIVSHQNVSELKRVQIELSESKGRIEAILDNVNNGIITLNPEGRVETANRASARIFGYPLKELVGLYLEDLMLGKSNEQMILRDLEGEYGHEIIGIRKDGSRFPIYVSLNQLQLNDSIIYTCIIQDITYRKRMEAEIIERERVQAALEKERELRALKNRFLSMMSHELNTPLASISLSYDMLKKYGEVSTPEENEQALDNIRQQVGHLRDMINDVMTLSRSEAEGLEIELTNTNLITYCRDIVEEFHFNYAKTHSVEFECDVATIRAMIDPRMLRRVFTNLLSNAIKYSPDGSNVSLSITTDHEDETAIIRVSDKGIGIPEADHTQLFEPFHRAANADALPGTGLGLAIVKQIIDLHDGTIDFETAEGEGTTFIIHLPLKIRV